MNLTNFSLFLPHKHDFHSDHISAYFIGMRIGKGLRSCVECFSYRTNHINKIGEFGYFLPVRKKQKSLLYSSFISQQSLCFENLFKIRKIYHDIGDDFEAELFKKNKLEEKILLQTDIRNYKEFQKYENRLSDIHPFKFFFNWYIANKIISKYEKN